MKTYGWTGRRTRDLCNSSKELYHRAIQTDIHGTCSPNYYTTINLCRVFPPITYNSRTLPVSLGALLLTTMLFNFSYYPNSLPFSVSHGSILFPTILFFPITHDSLPLNLAWPSPFTHSAVSFTLLTTIPYRSLSLMAPSLASFSAVSREFVLSIVARSLPSVLTSSQHRSVLSLTS